jgi:hypothetical protein
MHPPASYVKAPRSDLAPTTRKVLAPTSSSLWRRTAACLRPRCDTGRPIPPRPPVCHMAITLAYCRAKVADLRGEQATDRPCARAPALLHAPVPRRPREEALNTQRCVASFALLDLCVAMRGCGVVCAASPERAARLDCCRRRLLKLRTGNGSAEGAARRSRCG